MIIRRGRPILAAGLGMAAGAAIGRSQANKQQQAVDFQPEQNQRQQEQNQEDDILGKIKKLGELHKDGILTDIEFETKKAELLKLL